MTVKNLSYIKINIVNPLYLIIDEMNGSTEEDCGTKYLTLVSNDKAKTYMKKKWWKVK